MSQETPFSAKMVSSEIDDPPMVSVPMATKPFDTQGPSSTPPDSPPGYFDIAPNSRFFFPPKYASAEVKPSRAVAKEKHKGIYSHDPILDQDPDELWRFLVSNLRQPRMQLSVSGTHNETRTTTVISSDGTPDIVFYTVTVTDFSFEMDVSKYVIPQWSRIVARLPSSSLARKDQEQPMPTVREALEEYTSSKNSFKEFRLKKLLLWDYKRVTKLLTDFIRSTGYRKDINVAFPKQNYKVVALASNSYSRAAHSTLVRALCFLSCLCVVCWPAWAIARKRIKNRLVCEYGMMVNADEFCSRNFSNIHLVVTQRRKDRLVAM